MTLNKILILIFVIFMVACKKHKPIDEATEENACIIDTSSYHLNIPSYFPQIPYYNKIQLKNAKVKLGKKLYHDTHVSIMGNSCSSCHIQAESYSSTSVNSLPHINLIFNKNFLWAGKVQTGLFNIMQFEGNEHIDINSVSQDPEYKKLFCNAYGSDEVTYDKIAECLMQFVATIVSGNSKFEKYLRGEAILTDSEFNGLNIFTTEKGDCFHCHPLPLFTDNSFRNIGLDSSFNSSNWGVYQYTHSNSDIGKFKVPTLINVALTPPYMHDGRFQTLDEVIDFYNHGIKYSTTLDPLMMKNNRLQNGLQLTPQEKQDLKAFLLTLTDSTIITGQK